MTSSFLRSIPLAGTELRATRLATIRLAENQRHPTESQTSPTDSSAQGLARDHREFPCALPLSPGVFYSTVHAAQGDTGSVKASETLPHGGSGGR